MSSIYEQMAEGRRLTREEFIAQYKLLDDEYVDKETGFAFCKKCKTSRIVYLPQYSFIVKGRCECQNAEIKKLEELERKRKNFEKYKKLIDNSFASLKFKEASFDKLDMNRPSDFVEAVKRAKLFCENWQEIKRRGQGLYLFGDVGTGKTQLTACIGNELMKNYVPVLFTSFVEIAKQIKATYNGKGNEVMILNDIRDIDLLIIDDIGTERLVKNGEDTFMQEKVYDIINSRYANGKPTIFTSNYSMQELLTERGLEQRTVDRIAEMSTARIKLTGDSYRIKMVEKNKPLF